MVGFCSAGHIWIKLFLVGQVALQLSQSFKHFCNKGKKIEPVNIFTTRVYDSTMGRLTLHKFNISSCVLTPVQVIVWLLYI